VRRIGISLLLVLFSLPAGAQQHVTDVAVSGRVVECSPFAARFFPGEFNYCLGRKLWEKRRYESAREMFELAAGWGSKSAQSVLGVVLFNGEGIRADRALGLAWLALAAERENGFRRGVLASALQQATPGEKAEADRLLHAMRQKYGDEVAAARADRRYRREMASFRSNPVYGKGTCVSEWWGMMAPATSINDPNALPISGCTLLSEERVARKLEGRYAIYFAGWKGTVTVGESSPVRP